MAVALAYSPYETRCFPQDAYRKSLFRLVTDETRWLDLGCGRQLICDWLSNAAAEQRMLSAHCASLVGIDVDSSIRQNTYIHNAVVGDLHRLPFADSSFTLLTAQAVVEHVQRPVEFLRECRRVLKPGGQLLLLTPNLANWMVLLAWLTPDVVKRRVVSRLEGRREEDIFPTYYRMNTSRSINALAQQVSLTVRWIETIPSLKLPTTALLCLLEKSA